MPPSTLQRSAVLTACVDMIRACGLTLVELAEELARPVQPERVALLPFSGEVNIDAVHAQQAKPVPQIGPRPRALTHNDRRVIDAADNTEGITVAGVMELLTLQEAQAHRICSLLSESHHLTRVKKPGIRAMHFFARPADALAWFEKESQHQPSGRRAPPAAAPAPEPQETAAPAVAPAPFPEPAAAAVPVVAALSAAEVRSVEIHAAKVAGAKKAPAPMGARTPHKPKPAPHQNVTFSPPKIDDTRLRPAGEPVITADTKITRDTQQRPTARWQMRQEAPDERWPSFAAVRPGIDPATGKAWEARA